MSDDWAETTSIGTLRADQMGRPDVCFRYNRYLYRTLGKHVANGGMGSVYALERKADGDTRVEQVVGKTFLTNYLYQLRTDDVTRRDHHTNLAAMTRIGALEHPNVLPSYVSAPIADNYLFITPRMGTTLLEAITRHQLTPRARTKLLIQALEGLARLHEARIIHRDVTLRNILLDDSASCAFLFDFDLAVCFDDVGQTTYRALYRGRIFGSPGYSVPPETVDPGMLDCPVTTALDIYAIGGALHALFTDEMPYGPTDDMWGLLVRIADGIVINGKSKVHYPETVPYPIRPIIEGCLERDPAGRYPRVMSVIHDLRAALPELDDHSSDEHTFSSMSRGAPVVAPAERIGNVFSSRTDQRVTRAVIEVADHAVATWGYQIERSLGRVKGHHIYVAVPRPELLSAGSFPDANTFPKLVTLINLHSVPNPRQLVENWQAHFLPTLRKVRTGLMTSLHNVIYDANTGSLLLFSEYVDEPRFGTQLAEMDLHVDGALALAFLVVRQVAALHEHGMAHNNVHAGALLFKGLSDTRTVQPAMIGLVEPSLGAEAMQADTRALAALALSWLRPSRLAQLKQGARPDFDVFRTQLARWAYDTNAPPPGIDELMAATSDGLSLVDFNFSVLRDAGGDLQDYALMLVSHRLYHLLWPAH
ncbi:MAG: protein kinase [Deltaproteobacteria bacterium]|nr:protein kinase [Deltaproteobacteria bacterium]